MTFEEHLARARQKPIHRVNLADHHEWKSKARLYWFNKAEALQKGACVLSDNGGPPEAFALLAGLSLEVLLKGIANALDLPVREHHELDELRRELGIEVSPNDKIILDALSEEVIWKAKYPAPVERKNVHAWLRHFQLKDKRFRKSGSLADYHIAERDISRENYDRLWGLFVDYFFKAYEARIESTELDFGT